MSEFKQAAERASFDVRTEYAPLLGTYGVAISEKSAKKITEIIARHFVEIEAVYGKLVELTIATDAHIKASGNEGIFVVEELLNDQQVKSAIERSKG